jgi:hypothetical protein
MTTDAGTADLKAEAARYHAAFIKANEAVTAREVEIAAWSRLYAATIAERDRARDIAVALEGQVAAVRALAADRERLVMVLHGTDLAHVHAATARQIRAALDPDPADRGTGEPEEAT